MNGRAAVAAYIAAQGWRLEEIVDLGMTADVYIVHTDTERRALKVAREPAGAADLRREHALLRYLAESAAAPFAPVVGPWIAEIAGFPMTYLRYPPAPARRSPAWRDKLADALRALHHVPCDAVRDVPDDRPHPGRAFAARLQGLCDLLDRDEVWTALPGAHHEALAAVRARRPAYEAELVWAAALLDRQPPALVHGDLSGDNLMCDARGYLKLADWGEARISAPLTDVANLLAHAEWPAAQTRRFVARYLEQPAGVTPEEVAPEEVERLTRLYRFRVCVLSLLWLRGPEPQLDAFGQAFFKRQWQRL